MSRPRPDYPLCFLISSDVRGKVIGHGGAHIRAISEECRTRIDVRKHNAAEYMISIYGSTLASCCKACKCILNLLRDHLMTTDGVISLRILTNNILVGRLIGKYGTNLHYIKSSTDTNIVVNSDRNMAYNNSVERVVLITGKDVDSVARAGEMVSRKLQSNYEKYMASYFPNPNYYSSINPLNLPKLMEPLPCAFNYASQHGYGVGFNFGCRPTTHNKKGGFFQPYQKYGNRKFHAFPMN